MIYVYENSYRTRHEAKKFGVFSCNGGEETTLAKSKPREWVFDCLSFLFSPFLPKKKYKTDPHLSPFRSLEDKVENLVSNYSASYPNKNLSFTITTILPRVSTVASCFSKSSGVLFNHSPLASTTRVFFTPSFHSLPLFLQSFPQSSGAWRFNRFVPIEIPKMPSLTVEASFSSSRYIDWRVENSGS